MKILPVKKKASKTRAEYIKVNRNVRLHITDAGEGRSVVLLPGWPLSDEMYEYQYSDLVNKDFMVISTIRSGFGKSDKPDGAYNYDVYALNIKRVLDERWVAFQWAGPLLPGLSLPIMKPGYLNWFWPELLSRSGRKVKTSHTTCHRMLLMT